MMQALVVDDSRTMRMILSMALKNLGFEVTEASNGQEALERMRQQGKPDVALVDWNMPIMNGHDFVRAVRSEEAYQQLPLLMVTTETEMEQVATALQAGANEYVMKPFTTEVLRDKLQLLGFQIS